jgi:hypothetical protein
MNDGTIDIPVTERNELVAELRAAHSEHKNVLRRSIESSANFYEKLAAIDAGSLAIVASIGLAVTVKPELRLGVFGGLAHGIVVIAVLLWVSLVCAVIHNFFVVRITKLETAYSDVEFVITIITRTLSVVRKAFPEGDRSQLDGLEATAYSEPILEQQHIERRSKLSRGLATALGYASMLTFVAAYSAVMICILFLW